MQMMLRTLILSVLFYFTYSNPVHYYIHGGDNRVRLEAEAKNMLSGGDIKVQKNSEPDVYDPWSQFNYAVDLDVAGKYWMFWTPDEESQTITFEVHVQAHGYVGFGLSPTGGMTGSDVIIGWVRDSDGQPFFHDRHAVAESEPIIDENQDWTLLSANQNDTHTILRFSRPYITCDEDDRDITDDTTRVIFSFTDTDPTDITGLSYHGSSNRGTKSVVLKNYNKGEQSLPEDAVYADFLVTEKTIPIKRTTYWCEILRMEQKDTKHHAIMYEPIIQPGNEGLVHHIVLYLCQGPLKEEDVGVSWDCINNVMPQQEYCQAAWFVWAVGGNAFYLPDHTGIPFFEDPDLPLYMRVEMHYDNPDSIEGITDHSGLRVWMTPTLREHDTGLLITGHSVTSSHIIPPHFESATYRGFCGTNCINSVTDNNNEMNVYAVYQHAHLLGRALTTRIFRDGKELEPLLNDQNYDFNFQETRLLREERTIQRNDLLAVDCTYSSIDKNQLTLGGLATKNEMCVSFLYYYPAQNLTNCMSNPTQNQYLKIVDGLEIKSVAGWPYFEITAPEQYAGMSTVEVFNNLDWTNKTLQERFQNAILEEGGASWNVCGHMNSYTGEVFASPELGEEWIEPDTCA